MIISMFLDIILHYNEKQIFFFKRHHSLKIQPYVPWTEPSLHMCFLWPKTYLENTYVNILKPGISHKIHISDSS